MSAHSANTIPFRRPAVSDVLAPFFPRNVSNIKTIGDMHCASHTHKYSKAHNTTEKKQSTPILHVFFAAPQVRLGHTTGANIIMFSFYVRDLRIYFFFYYFSVLVVFCHIQVFPAFGGFCKCQVQSLVQVLGHHSCPHLNGVRRKFGNPREFDTSFPHADILLRLQTFVLVC